MAADKIWSRRARFRRAAAVSAGIADRRAHRDGARAARRQYRPTHVAEVLHRLYYETALAGSANSLLPTLQVTSAEHILFGTDWPAAPESTVVRNIANLTSFDGFTAEDLRHVERDNALRLFPRIT